MSLSQQAVLDYQQIYKKVHGKDISYEEALNQGLKLLRLFQLIYRPIPKQDRNGHMSNEKYATDKRNSHK